MDLGNRPRHHIEMREYRPAHTRSKRAIVILLILAVGVAVIGLLAYTVLTREMAKVSKTA